MTVWVVIPWRQGCGYRIDALNYVTRWWTTNHPDWPVTIGIWPRDRGPWRKGCAIRAAGIRAADNDVVVVADADVVPPGIDSAVAEIGSDRSKWQSPPARWAVPFRMVYRLTEPGTWLAINGGIDFTNPLPRDVTGVIEESYVGSPGGGIVALRGDVFNAIPIDPRFAGYGQEDLSWSLALSRMVGAPMRGTAPLWHLWHPPQARMRRGPTTSRGVGSELGLRLWHRYRQATTPATMQALIAETGAEFTRLMGDIDVGAY